LIKYGKVKKEEILDFLHQRDYYNGGDVIILDCDTQCNFVIMDDSNFSSYQRGDSHHYHGGHFTHFPARIGVPSSGHWNVVIDLGGGGATIQHSLSVVRTK
jgi:hypothetical protein